MEECSSLHGNAMAPHFQFLEQPLRFDAEVVFTNRAGSHGPYALVTHERSAEGQ